MTFFVSEEAEIIYVAIHFEGDNRLSKLGVVNAMKWDKEAAMLWRNNLLDRVHPSVCSHSQAAAATSVINNIYDNLIK